MDFKDLSQIPEIEVVPGFRVKFVYSQYMTFAHWNIKGGSSLQEHSHPHEQVTTVIEGEFELTVENVTKTLGPGSVVIIPSNAKHSARAVSDSKVIDAFYPIREDYLKKYSN
ncbi:MAG: putative pectin degradation protein [Desulfotomaculum sp. 46_296]|nr:MAG: putative pectin degradation protein [Desulfotomaculum sp. 46_296]HAU31374.1 cupin domain-containing protein [Desulfotomaculum sp.]